ncbi:MAG: hypothetical protein RL199_1052 [Pseudomonadota bacterium]
MSVLKRRADQLVLERGLAESRTKAQALILAGDIVASGGGAGDRRVDKPGDLLRDDVDLRLKGEGLRFVSRGGLKVEKALDAFALDPTGLRCLDLGASTGGFTDCLLQRGAREVVAVDVGWGQLHEKLRQDARVTSFERVNARDLPPAIGRFDLLVADLSFISLRLVLPGAVPFVNEGGHLVLLVKPQFECGREWVEKGGVVRDVAARQRAVDDVSRELVNLGCRIVGHVESPILGPAGNVEFLLVARRD